MDVVKESNGFDRLAPFYDRLAKFIYGRSIRDAQIIFLKRIPPFAKVLILGGGTGWILRELILAQPECEVWYIESSPKMLTMTRKQNHGRKIHFIEGTEKDIPSVEYDIVITHFFLDLFPDAALPDVIGRIKKSTRPAAYWLAADFIDTGLFWQRGLLTAMYAFFKLTCRIQADRLPAWKQALEKSGLKKEDMRLFFHGFIESTVYKT